MRIATGDKRARNRRLVEALRDNLRRRKAQIRGRAQGSRRAGGADLAYRGNEAQEDPKGD
jgi:ribosome assembly protein YihI (activator of Der GTPase)